MKQTTLFGTLLVFLALVTTAFAVADRDLQTLHDDVSALRTSVDILDFNVNVEKVKEPLDYTKLHELKTLLEVAKRNFKIYEENIKSIQKEVTVEQSLKLRDIAELLEATKGKIPKVEKKLTAVLATEPPKETPKIILVPIGVKTVLENQELTFKVQAKNNVERTTAYTVENLPTGATFIDKIFTWKPTFDQQGAYTVKFTATDGKQSISENVTITVIDVPQQPVNPPVNGTNPTPSNTTNTTLPQNNNTNPSSNPPQKTDVDLFKDFEKQYVDYYDEYYDIKNDLEDTCSESEKDDLLDDIDNIEDDVKKLKEKVNNLEASTTDSSVKKDADNLGDDLKDLRSKINNLQQNYKEYFCSANKAGDDSSNGYDDNDNADDTKSGSVQDPLQQAQNPVQPTTQPATPQVNVVALPSPALINDAIVEPQATPWMLIALVGVIVIAIILLFVLVFI